MLLLLMCCSGCQNCARFAECNTLPVRRHAAVVLGILFGLLSIYGTPSRIPQLGGVINIRNMGSLIAGLVGNVAPAMLAGTMGGTHRLPIGMDAGLIFRRWGLVRPIHAGPAVPCWKPVTSRSPYSSWAAG